MSLLPQIGFFELMLLAVLALVVVGPKDLPKLMRGIGRFVRQARSMADEFRAGFDEMARETEMAELREEIDALKKSNPVNEVKAAVEDTARLAEAKEPVKGAASTQKTLIEDPDQPAAADSKADEKTDTVS